MSKKKQIKINELLVEKNKPEVTPIIAKAPWYTTFLFQALLLLFIGLVCFANSFKNLYALDDDAIILKNQYVQVGVKGIPQILSSDAEGSLYNQWGTGQTLSGGRYRPLSIISFAIEQQLLDTVIASDTTSLLYQNKPTAIQQISIIKLANERHAINVLFYILSVLVLLYFLKNFIFIEQPIISFLACLFFLIHPIHTEVVANIKSRDEIFSFLFFISTFITAFRYYDTRQKKYLWLSLGFYFLALLSKEYAITILVLLPMLFYIVKKEDLSKSLVRTFPFLLVAIVYIIIRMSVVGLGNNADSTELLNNPFLFATDIEKFATKILILNKYLWLLIHPTILSSDYSYNTIPYTDFTDIWVWLSLFILAAMITATIILFRKRNIIAFALAFYLLHLFLVSNFVFDLGATMGERLIYHSSLGFVIIVAMGCNYLLQKIKYPAVKSTILVAVCLLTVGWCAAKDIQRNSEWKENATLYFADVKKYPNSCFLNNNVASCLIDSAAITTDSLVKREITNQAIVLLKKAVAIHDGFATAYLNLGFCYYLNGALDSSKDSYDKLKIIFPKYAYLPAYYHQLAVAYSTKAIGFENTDPIKAVHLFEKAVACDPNDANNLNNLAFGYYHFTNQPQQAKELWQRSLQLAPGNQPAVQGISLFNK